MEVGGTVQKGLAVENRESGRGIVFSGGFYPSPPPPVSRADAHLYRQKGEIALAPGVGDVCRRQKESNTVTKREPHQYQVGVAGSRPTREGGAFLVVSKRVILKRAAHAHVCAGSSDFCFRDRLQGMCLGSCMWVYCIHVGVLYSCVYMRASARVHIFIRFLLSCGGVCLLLLLCYSCALCGNGRHAVHAMQAHGACLDSTQVVG